MQKSSFNKLSILLFIIVILSSCNKDNGIEEISVNHIYEIKVLRISKDNTKTPIYNEIAYIYYDIAPIDLFANYIQIKGMVYTNGKNTIIPNQVKEQHRWLSRNNQETIHSITVFIHDTNSVCWDFYLYWSNRQNQIKETIKYFIDY